MQTIKIDFDNPGLPQRLDVVENDAQSRFFKAVLYKDGKAYAAPSGATYSIMYRGFGPQNEGWYDTINDGAGKRSACSVSGNVVTCEIAHQALRVPGHVSVVLCVTGSNGYMLHGWPIDCNCRNDNYTGGTLVESFFYITQITNADWTSAIKTWEELKNMIDPTLSLSGKAADAAKVGEAVNAEATRAKRVEEEIAKRIGQLKEEKIDNPSSNDDGKIARAKAGGVEWVDVGQPTDAQTESAVTKWLNKHPEATTTVQDGAITKNKIDNNFLLYIEKDYTTPQMFGAKADGITDDSNAIFAAINASKTIVFPQGIYKCTAAIDISDKNIYAEEAILDFADFIGECCITSTTNGTNIHGLNIKNASPSEYAVNLQYFANGCSCENLRITNSTKGIRISGSWYTSFNNIEINIVSESGTCMTIDNSRYGNPVNAITFTNISLNGGAIGLSVQGSTVNSLVFSGIAIENQSEFGVKTENSYGNITFDGIYFEGRKNATLFNSKLYIDIGSILVRGKYNAFANDDNQIILRSRPYNPANIILNAQQKTYCNDLGKRYYPRFLSDANVRDHYIEKQEGQDNFTLYLKNSISPLYIRLLCFGRDTSDTTTQSLDIIELFVFTETEGKKVLPQYKSFSSRTFVQQYTISTRINGSNLEINLSNSSEYFFRSRLIIIASYFGSESTVKTLE
jgi:hypothetical protein